MSIAMVEAMRNALKRYGAFLLYGIIVVSILGLLQSSGSIVFAKVAAKIARRFTEVPATFYSGVFLGGLYFVNVVLQVYVSSAFISHI